MVLVAYRVTVHEGLPVRAVPVPTTTRPPARGGVVLACLAVAAASAVGVWLLWRTFVDTWAGQRVEDAAYDGAVIGQGRLWRVAEPVLDVVSVGFLVGALVTAVGVAVVRRRWGLAVQVAVLVGGANLTTQVVKHVVLDRPELGVGADYGNTLPSGHTTVAASVGAALLIVAPPRVRPLVAVAGAVWTATTGVSTLVGQWHRPSDVVAAVLVVLGWTALVCAATALRPAVARTATGGLPRVGGRDPWRARTRRTVVALTVVGVAAGAVSVVLLVQTWALRGASRTRGGEMLAYGGGVSAVVAASCVMFVTILLLRHAAGSRDETTASHA